MKRARLASDVTSDVFKRVNILMGERICNGVGKFFMAGANY